MEKASSLFSRMRNILADEVANCYLRVIGYTG